VRNAVVVAPIEPNVEISANPIGPQLQAPAMLPITEPKILPFIFCFELLRTLIRKIFIGITKADNAESITIRNKPNSVPGGKWLTTYGSKKIYSDKRSKPTNIDAKITNEMARYVECENTSLIACVI